MSDRDQGGARSGANEMDFTGLLPGDDQPRRRRRRGTAARTGRAPASAEQETVEGSPATPDEPEVGEGQPPPRSTADQAGPSGRPAEPSEHDAAPERADLPENGSGGGTGARPPDAGSPEVTTSSARDADENPPEQGPSDLDVPGHQERQTRGSAGSVSSETADPARDRRPAGASREPPDPTEETEAARRAAREAQAALVEGRDLDEKLGRLSALPPERRSEYKTSIALSEDHYDILADLRKDFRRRGFSGHEATVSNVIALGLEVMRDALEAEKRLPSP